MLPIKLQTYRNEQSPIDCKAFILNHRLPEAELSQQLRKKVCRFRRQLSSSHDPADDFHGFSRFSDCRARKVRCHHEGKRKVSYETNDMRDKKSTERWMKENLQSWKWQKYQVNQVNGEDRNELGAENCVDYVDAVVQCVYCVWYELVPCVRLPNMNDIHELAARCQRAKKAISIRMN